MALASVPSGIGFAVGLIPPARPPIQCRPA